MAEESVTHKTARTAFWIALQRFAGMGIGFVVTMILARLLTPGDYGAVALQGVFFGLCSTVIECGFRNALIRKDHCSQADYSTAFLYNVGVSSLLYLVIYFWGAPFAARFYDMPILCPVMRWTGLSMVIGSVNMVQGVILTRQLDFKRPAAFNITAGILSAAVGITAAFYGLGVWALVIQGLFSCVINTGFMVWVVRWKPTLEFSRDSFRYLWDFGSKMLVTHIISTIFYNIYSIVIGKFYTATDLGLFNRGNRSSKFFPDLINGIFSGNTLPILSQLRNDRTRMLQVYRKYVRLLSFINFPLCMLMCALAEPYVLVLLGEQWTGAIIFLQIFSLAAILEPAQYLNLTIFQVEGRTDITLKLEVAKKAVGFTVVFVAMNYGTLTLALTSAAYSVFAYTVNLFAVNRLEKLSYTQQWQDMWPSFWTSAVAAGTAWWVQSQLGMPLLRFAAGGVAGVAVYFVLTRYVLRMDVYDNLFQLMPWLRRRPATASA